jgi:hypothetical protein
VARLSTRLCGEPLCGQVGVEVPSGWRCPEHLRPGWSTWKAANPQKSIGYDRRWARFRAAILRERGERCETCGATDVPLELHHLDRQGAMGERGFDPTNVRVLCVPCHVRAGQPSEASGGRRTTRRRR